MYYRYINANRIDGGIIWGRNMKKKRKFEVSYTEFDKTLEVEKYLKSLGNLIKLNQV